MYLLSLAAVALATLPLPTVAATEKFALQSNVDHIWTMTAAGLVFLMQAGFMLLEAGSVRSKNSVNVAQKNLIDFLLATVGFGAVGFSIMFGVSHAGWFGWSSEIAFFSASEDWSMTFFVFQLVFCGTAATIVSGAVAERMTMGGYILCTMLIALLIYPIVGHWAWGGLLNGQDEPWLAAMGFMDFAGGVVVHSVGAWVGLAVIMIIGARRGRFDAKGKPVTLHRHSPILATVGCIIIWVGWIGFNGGSTTAGTSDFAKIVQNTMISGGVAGAVALIVGRATLGYFTPISAINGALAGLVAITPGCDVMTGQGAMLLGAVSGVLIRASEAFFEHVFKLDDPLGAVSVHGVCGAFGTIMLAVLAPSDALVLGSRADQIVVQIVGVVSVFAWAFGVAWVILSIVSKVTAPKGGGSGLRVSEQAEEIGLNVSEHRVPLGTGALHQALHQIAKAPDQPFQRIVLERGDEAYEMSQLVNQLMGELSDAMVELEDVVCAASAGDFSKRIDADKYSGAPQRICRDINSINETCERGLTLLQKRVTRLAAGDLVSPIEEQMEGQFAEFKTSLTEATAVLRETIGSIKSSADGARLSADDIVNASRELSDKATAQRKRVDGALPVLGEVSAISERNSTYTEKAAALCEHALGEAQASMEAASSALESMEGADAAAVEIDEAVTTVEDIAQQINFLAVNAGVEASHAQRAEGSNGGFKILARE
ncbi:MAG: ammonium transporter, partial [Pseudomonadota bacterium]